MSDSKESPPPHIWRGLGLSAVLLLVIAVVTIGLISAGAFDPQPAGDDRQQWSLEPLTLAPGERHYVWREEPRVAGTFTLRLTVALQDGENDVGYGLALGGPQRTLTAAVSPLGYAAVWLDGSDGNGSAEMLLPWQPWPHVRRGGQPNEIQVDVVQETVTIRVNREILWQGNASVRDGSTALYAESFGEATTIGFQELVLFEPLR